MVVDDLGGIPKTLSVEVSYRRGTVCTQERVLILVEDLYIRLPRLFKNRTEWSTDKQNAYPTTIRLTVRSVAQSASVSTSKRPFEARSQQSSFDGRALLMNQSSVHQQRNLLRSAISPLLNSLVFSSSSSGGIDVTKINIALCNFQDVHTRSTVDVIRDGTTLRNFYAGLAGSKSDTKSHSHPKRTRTAETVGGSPVSATTPNFSEAAVASILPSDCDSIGVDPSFLSELPPDIAAEVMRDLRMNQPNNTASPRRKQRIDQYFPKK
jgi:hypothetical protein